VICIRASKKARRSWVGIGGVAALVAGYLGLAGPLASAKQAAATNVPSQQTMSSGAITPRVVERVVVWGFRVRPDLFDRRRPALNAGYAAAVGKTDCETQACAFVVLHDGQGWRLTTVQAGPEERLLSMRDQIQGSESTFVIVYPPAGRLKPPYF
jgi:hypothetical protein